MVSEKIVAERQIGMFCGQEGGANIVFLAGVHGNEPAALVALEKVFQILAEIPVNFSGKMLAFMGNSAAFSNGMRYVDEDLNRIWKAADMAELEESPNYGIDKTAEEGERRQLYNALLTYL